MKQHFTFTIDSGKIHVLTEEITIPEAAGVMLYLLVNRAVTDAINAKKKPAKKVTKKNKK